MKDKKISADLQETQETHLRFSHFNTQIDHVLLNTETHDDLASQMLKLLKKYS